ncbi:MAG: hypothetical protein RBR86_07015 [Pseudobdellovibrionaceae bacterium]|jgi:hypothetical protein|nr:hypothetical protein [Pseudobdellovibrionaceae bacterium]
MTDVTLDQTLKAFEECKVSPGERNLNAKVATDLIGIDSSAQSIATHARISQAGAQCVVGKVTGTYEEPSTYEKMKGFLKEAYDNVKDGIQSINSADVKRAAGMAIQDAANTVTGGGVDAAQTAATKSGMPLRTPNLGG